MIASKRDPMTGAIRESVAQHDFEAADRLLGEYVKSLSADSNTELTAARDFLQSVRIAVLSRKAHIAEKLRALDRSQTYRTHNEGASSWSFQG